MKKISTFIVTSILLLAFVSPAEAARLLFETSVTEVGVGQRVEIAVRLDSQGETINALKGTIVIPSSLFLQGIRDGNSMITFWAERPKANLGNSIPFSGIIPGGWKGADGEVFSFIVETKTEGTSNITLSGQQVLLHDGEGTPTQAQTGSLTILADEAIELQDLVAVIEDAEPPEQFTPLLGQDPGVFNEDYFLTFVAQDKGSGIDHYEVQETKERLEDELQGEWTTEISPYRIQDQSLQSLVYVRAVDRSGNIRLSVWRPPLFDIVVEPRIPPTKIPVVLILIAIVILLAIAITVGLVTKRGQQKKSKQNSSPPVSGPQQ